MPQSPPYPAISTLLNVLLLSIAKMKTTKGAQMTKAIPEADMFWGDRCGNVKDPFGYSWMIATHTKDLTQEQITKAAQEFFSQMAKG